MLLANRVAGNVFSKSRNAMKARRARNARDMERIFLSRSEMQKVRLRRKTDRGTDIGLVLEQGEKLHHGDILDVQGRYIIVEQLPEKVVSVLIGSGNANERLQVAALVGHTVGNRHRPLAVSGGTISFPLQSESELDMFQRLLPPGVKLTTSTEVFVPAAEVHHHE